ncbi:MAG: 30S ribosomal protein S16 [Bacillota bacterium]|jgi:small subunit ribosomal protein S16|nr:30S ribosomal protein S16 [Bacillota bacterium]HHU43649.1 30S ribosomal protein S16 [Clostridiales bacterium]
MAVKIRLTRMGAKKSPFYRIVATDSRKARDGQYLEQIGYYDPTKEPAALKIDKEIAEKWLKVGAQPTETVKSLFKREGIVINKGK